MTLDELARLGKAMRDCQCRYFRTRQAGDLNASRDAERRFDRAVDAVLKPPAPDLFAPQPETMEGDRD